MACWATVVGAPGRLPAGWAEVPRPPWSAGAGERFACPEHAEQELERVDRQWLLYAERTFVVSAADHERLVRSIRTLEQDLAQLKFSGERVANRKL
jgi:hypothetical protein